jgi:hypothetical protein
MSREASSVRRTSAGLELTARRAGISDPASDKRRAPGIMITSAAMRRTAATFLRRPAQLDLVEGDLHVAIGADGHGR